MLLVEQQLLQTGPWHWNVMVDAESVEVFETLAHTHFLSLLLT